MKLYYVNILSFGIYKFFTKHGLDNPILEHVYVQNDGNIYI